MTQRGYSWIPLAFVLLFYCCSIPEKKSDLYSSSLFQDVQLRAVFPDSKTFVDCTPKKDISEILQEYERIKDKPDFDLKEFVYRNFELPVRPKSTFATDTTLAMEE